MNLLYGEIVEVITESGMMFGRVRMSGVVKKIPLELVTNPQVGDKVLVCDGIAINRVTAAPLAEKG